jgi:DNA-directed RNA polymerase subunit RPC12/RpoP
MTIKKLKPRDDKSIISDEYFKSEKPSYLCSWCSQNLVKLMDASHNNTTYWCHFCSIEYDPEAENLRKESKIFVPDRDQEGSGIISVDNNIDVSVRHEPPMRGGFKELSKKGTIRFTSYNTTEKQ